MPSSTAEFYTPAGDYAEKYVLGGPQIFENLGPSAGGNELMITTAELLVDTNDATEVSASYRLHLYSAPPKVFGDKTHWGLVREDSIAYHGYIDFERPLDFIDTFFAQKNNVNNQITIGQGGAIWGYLVTLAPFTTTNASHHIRLRGVSL